MYHIVYRTVVRVAAGPLAAFSLAGCDTPTVPRAAGPRPALDAASSDIVGRDLGTLGGRSARASAINVRGQVVGFSATASGASHAFLWSSADGIRDLGTLGGTTSAAAGINARGEMVGLAATANGQTHAVLWSSAGEVRDLGTLGGDASQAAAINDLGQVVGSSKTASGETRAFLWTDARGTSDLGALAGVGSSTATDINNRGQIVGTSGTLSQAWLWSEAEGRIDLAPLPGATATQAEAVNDRGEVVGYSMLASGETHAFLWSAERGTRDLGSLGGTVSAAYGVNGRGDVVGSSSLEGAGRFRAFVWNAGTGMRGLGIPADARSATAYDIDDAGQAVGLTETASRELRATLWTVPVENAAPMIAELRTDPAAGPFSIGAGACGGRHTVCLRFQVAAASGATDAPLQTVVDWGDGSSWTPNRVPAATPLLAAHDYSRPGSYAVVVTVIDQRGAFITQRVDLRVTP